MTSADQTETPDQTAGPDWSAVRAHAGYWAQEIVGLVPPLCALGTAAFFQTQTMHMVFAWPWGTAWIPAACIEGGVAYFGLLYERHLVAGDSTIANRVWMLLCAAVSCATIYWHVTAQLHKPWQMAAVVGGMAALSLALWMRRSKWRRRELLRARGLIDAQVPRFSVARWVLCPLETPSAFRYAVKHSISDPLEALAAYRADRERGDAMTPDLGAPKVEVSSDGLILVDGVPIGEPEPDRAAPTAVAPARKARPRSGSPKPTAAIPLRRKDYADECRAVDDMFPAVRTPTLDQIQTAVAGLLGTCGREKATKVSAALPAYRAAKQTADQTDEADPDREAVSS